MAKTHLDRGGRFTGRRCWPSPAAAQAPGTTEATPTAGDLRVWLMHDSVSEDAVAWLEDEFAAQNPGSTLTVEMQPWG